MSHLQVVAAIFISATLAGCNQTQPSVQTEKAHTMLPAEPVAEATQACMIAGELLLAGKIIRSRDCTQASRNAPRAKFESYCETLANTSAELGGKAGVITYLDKCPSPNQGSCKNFANSGLDGFYYERTADDLAELPESCEHDGGTWVN